MNEYDDMINLPRPRASKYAHMSIDQRAAQFASFAALRGLDEEIAETARHTEERPELDDAQREAIDAVLRGISARLPADVEVTYFVADERKKGGSIRIKRGQVVKMTDDALIFAAPPAVVSSNGTVEVFDFCDVPIPTSDILDIYTM